MLEVISTAKRNLNSQLQLTVKRFGLDLIDIVLVTIFVAWTISLLMRRGKRLLEKMFWIELKRYWVQKFLTLAFVSKKINKEINKVAQETREGFRKKNPAPLVTEMPEKGMPWEQIDAKLAKLNSPDKLLKSGGKLSGMYYVSGEIEQSIYERSAPFLYYNLMHADKVVGVRQTEAELISFFLKLMKGGSDSRGVSTSGGTESILIAMYTFRSLAFTKKGITEPELILPVSAHSAFFKACDYFKIRPRIVPLNKETFEMDVDKTRSMINGNTIGIVCSAGNYPYGIIDPIPQIAEVARPYDIPIHVDGCLGGYSAIFGREMGYDIPQFDFTLPEVATFSIDPHKYGLAPKGISLLLFRDSDLKLASIFVQEDWTGGLYATTSVTGSKPAASLVGAYVATLRLGKEGFRKEVKAIHEELMKVLAQLRKVPHIHVIGNPVLNTFAFKLEDGFTDFSILQVGEGMIRKEWYAPVIQHPSAIHFAITKGNIDGFAEAFIKDVTDVMNDLKKDPTLFNETKSGQIYCSKLKVPDGCIIADTVRNVVAEFSVA